MQDDTQGSYLAERMMRLAERDIRRQVRQPVMIDMKQALKCGTALGRRPRSRYAAD